MSSPSRPNIFTRLKGFTLLPWTISLDGLLHLVFGSISFLYPYQTFGTIIRINSTSKGSAMIPILANMSLLYILIGFLYLLIARLPITYQRWLLMPPLLIHIAIGAKGYFDIGQPWLIGNPWPDIIIHVTFSFIYAITILGVIYNSTEWQGK